MADRVKVEVPAMPLNVQPGAVQVRLGPLPADAFVFARGDDAALKSFRTAWELAGKRAKLDDVRFHDLRSEYASRLVENDTPLSQVRDLLGHCSIVVTERYDRQVLATLKKAAGTLDDGQPFKNLSSSDAQPSAVESVSSTLGGGTGRRAGLNTRPASSGRFGLRGTVAESRA